MVPKGRILNSIFLLIVPTILISQVVVGRVISNKNPLDGVNISKLKYKTGSTTDSNGKFSIDANIGDLLIFSYLGFKTVEFKVSDFEKITIYMVPESNVLDEAVVKANKKSEDNSFEKDDTFSSYFGEQDLKNAGYSIEQVKGSSLSYAAPNIGTIPAVVFALNGKVTNYQVTPYGVVLRSKGSLNLSSNAALWEIDGMTFEGFPPPIDISFIEDIYVIKSLAGTIKYGSRGAGGVIIIKTINNTYGKKQDKSKKISDTSVSYKSLTRRNEFRDFEQKENFNKNAKKIGNDINGLRGLAYHYQEKGEQLLAARLYQKVLSLSPANLKSHRDIAHTWMISSRPMKSWASYLIGFKQSNNTNEDIFRRVMFHEMERLYIVENLDGRTNRTFKTESKFGNSENYTTRIVFEWSSSVHNLAIESINPEGLAYKSSFGPSHGTEQTIEEFFLDNTLKGQWRFNIIPQATNDKPLYLKVTIYPNWYSLLKSTAAIKNFIFYSNDDLKYQLFTRMVF